MYVLCMYVCVCVRMYVCMLVCIHATAAQHCTKHAVQFKVHLITCVYVYSADTVYSDQFNALLYSFCSTRKHVLQCMQMLLVD